MYRNKRKGPAATSTLLSSNAGASTSRQHSATSLVTNNTISSIGSVLQDTRNLPDNGTPEKLQRLEPDNEDIFTIPASQEPFHRRYISQRSMMSQSQRSQTQSGRQRARNYFEKVLIKCGAVLDFPECYALEIDHITFVCRLRLELQSRQNHKRNVTEFLAGLELTMSVNVTLLKLLSGCRVTLPPSNMTKLSQESLFKDLLMIDFLEIELIPILFKKVCALTAENTGDNYVLVEFLLSQLKFVRQIENGATIFDNVFELLATATAAVRLIIINQMEDIIPTLRHDDVSKRLMEMFTSDTELLTRQTVDAFANMNISSKMHIKIEQRIICYMKNGAPIQLWPAFTQFVLRLDTNELDHLPNLINDLRDCLQWHHSVEPRKDINDSQCAVFECIYRTVTRSNKVFGIWLKIIQAMPSDEEKPIDLLVLLMMMSINDERSNYIENIIRKKIKSDSLYVRHLESAALTYPLILNKYSTIFLELLDSFFKDKHYLISNFGKQSLKLIFSVEGFDRKLLLSKLVGFVCQGKDITNDIEKSSKMTTNALTLLTNINTEFPGDMQQNGNQLLRILDRNTDLTLRQVRMVMDLLCSVAYDSAEKENTLQEHLDMMVCKQVQSNSIATKVQGIVGTCRIIDHIIWQKAADDDDDSVASVTFESIDDLPAGKGQMAAKYFELIVSASCKFPLMLSLCYDELSTIISHRNAQYQREMVIDPNYLTWLYDSVTSKFQKNFIVDEVPTIGSDISIEYQMYINASDEISDSNTEVEHIAVNIVGCVLEPSDSAESSITILPSLFNLLRILHSTKNHGNLVSINAVLGCAIVLPKCIANEDMDIFDDFDDIMAKKILDIMVYTVNWIRETIGGFASQDDAIIKKKVMMRLTELTKIEDKVKSFLKRAPADYVTPRCQFTSPSSTRFKVPNAVKRVLSKKNTSTETAPVETENMSILATMRSQDANRTGRLNETRQKIAKHVDRFEMNSTSSLSYGPREFYRPMDLDVIFLLHENLVVAAPLTHDQIGYHLGLLEFRFLIEDLVTKLEFVLGVRHANFADDGQQYAITEAYLIGIVTKFLPNIMKFFVQLSDHIKSLIHDDTDKSSIFSDAANLTKQCIGLCLRLLATFYTWSGFEGNTNISILRQSLLTVCQMESNETISVQELASDALNTIIVHEAMLLDLTAAVHLVHLAEMLVKLSGESASASKRLVNLCKVFLMRNWFTFEGTVERGASCNILLDQLLKGLFREPTLNSYKQYLTKVLNELSKLNGKDDTLDIFPCFHKANFPLLYRALCGALLSMVSRRLARSGPALTQLMLWEDSLGLLNDLLEMMKKMKITKNFSLFMRSNQNTVVSAQIPFVRETMELLLVRVKELMVTNKCVSTDVLNFGNLKNKDLDGNALSEQVDDYGDEDDEAYMPPHEEDDDDDIDDERSSLVRETSGSLSNNTSNASNASRIF